MNIGSVGNTPLERCNYLSEKYVCEIYIKKEYYNPSKSSKDRPALYMINDAICHHSLSRGSTLVEASSGNTGIGIACLARMHHFKVVIFVSKSCSPEKLAELEELGAKVFVCENSNGMQDKLSTQYRATQYVRTHKNCYYTNQYANQANYRAHLETTGPEIWQQSMGLITHFFAGIGTGGTISGVGQYLKSQNPHVQVYGIEPCGSVLAYYKKHGRVPEKPIPMEKIDGIGRTFVPNVFDASVVDDILQVGVEKTKHVAREYYIQQKELIGFSSAAVLSGFDEYVQHHDIEKNSRIVLLFADHGSRYRLSLYPELADNEIMDYANI
ncbi:MAG TPA: PLP-dependent cysteine synthase family protein [Sphingobacterium sp.]|nr:PLP-dependent cysteine synthase family protein [Sphingobacterium sp.]